MLPKAFFYYIIGLIAFFNSNDTKCPFICYDRTRTSHRGNKQLSENARKHDRVLELYNRLLAGDVLHKDKLAFEYGVTPRSIQRDIDSIRDFCSNQSTRTGETAKVIYDHSAKGFRLVNSRAVTLTNAELFAVSKILLENRSLAKTEIEDIIFKLVEACLPTVEKKRMASLLSNELFHYVEPHHGKRLVDCVWDISSAISHQKIIHMEYQKTNGTISTVSIKPVGITCSEYYFYLIAYFGDNDKLHPGYPTIYHIDRIQDYQITNESFSIPYRDRFEEGEFRKRIPFMYGGKLQKSRFRYTGPDINAVLDRLPTAKAVKQEDGSYVVDVEVFGPIGLNMWLKSQGDYVEILS